MRKIGMAVLAAVLATSAVSCKKKNELGNVLRVALRAKYKSIDPAHGGDYYSSIEISRAYQGLIQYNYEKRPYVIEPLLAEAMPVVSKDGRTYTFKLKGGVFFHDDSCFPDGKGRELVAEDFVYSFQRVMDPKESSEGKWMFDDKVASLKALDSRTFQIVLSKPYAVFLHLLTMPGASVVPRECVEKYGKDFSQHPVGTGPFQLEHIMQNQIVWVKNPKYSAVEKLNLVDKVIDDIIVEDQPAWLNFMQGNHDYLMKVPKDNVATVWGGDHRPSKELLDKGVEVLTTPAVDYTYIAFNMEDSVLGGEKNKWLRQAMSLAYDESSLIDKFYLGLAVRAEFLIPPGISGYDSKYRNPFRQYNLTKAREMLASHGFAGGKGLPEITYEAMSTTTSRQLTEHFVRQMSELGISVKVNMSTWPELLARIRTKKAQLFGISWLYDYPDAENGLQLLYSKNESPGPNEANYKNKKFDAFYEQAAPMADSPERRTLFAKMRDIAAEDAPWIYGVHTTETRLVQSWTKNYKIHAFEHCHEKYMHIDVEARNKALK